MAVKSKKWLAIALAAVLAFALVGCGNGDASEPAEGNASAGEELTGSINIEGSDTMVNLGQAWAETFQNDNPGVMISIKGGGSGTGIAALINGTIDLALSSREIKEEEVADAQDRDIDPFEIEVATDGIAVVAHPDNQLAGLTMDQLGQIYRGEITNWSEVGGTDGQIVLLSRDSASGTYEFFKEAVVGKDNEYAREAKLLPSTQAIIDETKNNPNAIGYVGIGYVVPEVKILELDGIAASIEAARDGSYGLSRGLFYYSDGEPAGVVKSFIDWVLTPEGQKVVEEQGFVPVGN